MSHEKSINNNTIDFWKLLWSDSSRFINRNLCWATLVCQSYWESMGNNIRYFICYKH
jgi:hypothetical protein